ncbi:MAG: LPXTG cell wall anchor domain-containing protein [Acidobacteria bacterium]|nr:LPXTG cell wall anchor domain-containing protein [Acidobacteriota bacterium]
MDQQTVQIIAGVLALVLVAIIVLRRKSKSKKTSDEF